MQRVLHCYAFGCEGAWEASCIDLDLAAQGGSFEEVASLLQEAITFHLERVMELPEKDRTRLLNRRVPWHVRLRYASEALLLHAAPGWRAV